jgi:hypothetical protein
MCPEKGIKFSSGTLSLLYLSLYTEEIENTKSALRKVVQILL